MKTTRFYLVHTVCGLLDFIELLVFMAISVFKRPFAALEPLVRYGWLKSSIAYFSIPATEIPVIFFKDTEIILYQINSRATAGVRSVSWTSGWAAKNTKYHRANVSELLLMAIKRKLSERSVWCTEYDSHHQILQRKQTQHLMTAFLSTKYMFIVTCYRVNFTFMASH